MATRHLRRLQQQQQQTTERNEGVRSAASEEDNEQEDNHKSAPFNPFDLLNDGEDSGQGSVEEEEEDTGDSRRSETKGKTQSQPAAELPPAGSTANSKLNSREQGKKAKGKKSAWSSKGIACTSQAEDALQPSANVQPARHQDDDDIDRILAELDIKVPDAIAGPSNSTAQGAETSGGSKHQSKRLAAVQAAALLAVEPRRLRGDAELRRIFGRSVIEEVDRADEAGSSTARRRGMVPRNAARRSRWPMRRTWWLVNPKDDWPPFSAELGMSPAGSCNDGALLFEYSQTPAYRAAQAAFEQVQASGDPNAVVALLQRMPYHVEALLAMVDLYRHMGEAEYSERMLDMALFSLEAAWHPSFAPGVARLDFEEPLNRPFFAALQRHMQALSRRGCHTAALECCKLLLSLDLEDPLGCLQHLDYLALRAGAYDYLQRFVAEFEGDQALALLPNFAYGVALAMLHQQQQQQKSPAVVHMNAPLQGPLSQGACGKALLLQAVLLHPQVVPPLLARLRDQGSARDAAWTSVLGRKLFQPTARNKSSQSLAHLVALYVERSYLLWKGPDPQAWLLEAAKVAAEFAEGGSPPAWYKGPSDQDWARVQEESFPADNDENEYRHLRLHEFSDQVNMLPREEVQAAIAGGDAAEGLADALDEQVLAAQLAAVQRHAAAGRRMTEEELRAANPLLMLLRTMLPWFDEGEQPEYGEDDRPDGDGNAM